LTDAPKVAVITGASRGIGAGVVSAFRQAGYAVIGTALTIQAADEADFVTVGGDIAEPETAEQIVALALDRFGRIDALVNNAGLFIGKAFTEYTVQDYTAMVAVNLTGFFHITQRVIRHMRSEQAGHVVNISTSLVDHARSDSPAGLASLTKGGLDAVTRSLAIEYASHNVRVNAVSLGVIETAPNQS
jgi:NAD(P)-dependent dehydrogenase (short-subunit alcohol dehydrogenase family)